MFEGDELRLSPPKESCALCKAFGRLDGICIGPVGILVVEAIGIPGCEEPLAGYTT